MEYFISTKDSLDTADVIQFNDYTGTREEFWRENFVVVTLNVSMMYKNHCSIHFFTICIYLQAIQKQALTIKNAAALLGISYNILYQKYRDDFGKIGYKTVKQRCPDSDDDHEVYSNDISSDDQEGKMVTNSLVTRSGRRARGPVKVKDIDNYDEVDNDSNILCDEENDNTSKKMEIISPPPNLQK